MIILRTPKGWTAPNDLDGHRLEGSWRAHQIPIPDVVDNPAHLQLLEAWMRRYRPEELFDAEGRLVPHLKALAPTGARRSGNPHADGGVLRIPLRLPDFGASAVPVSAPGASRAPATQILGEFLRDVMRDNMGNFRVSGPDETGPTACGRSTKPARRRGSPATGPRTPMAASSHQTAASWKCSASTR